MALPKRFTIYGCAYGLDGGTTSLQAVDETGRERVLVLVQHAFPKASRSLDAIPGRLYFDGELVPMRSELEAGILSLLRAADIRYGGTSSDQGERIRLSPTALILGDDIREVMTRGPDENIRALTAAVVRFVESEEYLRFADRVEQTADPTHYTVRLAWSADDRKQVMVRLSQVLGVGLQAARDMLELGKPLAEGISAIEVTELASRYRDASLSVRVEPVFRWQLL